MTPVADFVLCGRSGVPLLTSALSFPNRLSSGSPEREAAVCRELILIMDSTPGDWMEVSPQVSQQTLQPQGT